MEYNEEYFAKSANKKAMLVWMLINIVLSVAYTIELLKGQRTMGYFIAFISMCWIPFFAGVAVLKIVGMGTKIYKDVIAVGYGIFYAFVMFTTNSVLTVMYILPLTSMLVLFKNRNYILRCCVANMAVIIISVIHNYMGGMTTPRNIADFEIQVIATLLCYVGYVLSINHLNQSDGAMLGSVQSNLDKVVLTIEQVKQQVQQS